MGAQLPDKIIKVPRELHTVRASALEEYVRERIDQFVRSFTPRLQDLASTLTSESIERAVTDTINALPMPDYGQIPLENMELQLVFRHDCLALGCLDPQCSLCQHNSNRRCSYNFDRKYLVNDVLKAKCGAIIRVELVDKGTGMVVEEPIPDLRVEMVMLDGNMYETKCMDSERTVDSEEHERELESCMLLLNNKQQPLLMCGPGGTSDPSGKVVLQLQRGKAVMPEVHATDSSEALLSGRKPPYRLLVRALCKGSGPKLNIRYAVSEGFVVATRRTRTAGKADIPRVDDHVSKLEHMGKETVKKLQDINGAAIQCGTEISIPENTVQTVGDFKQLALRAEQDGHLRQKLQHVLKLSKEKWDEARDHAMKAVVADNRMRAWYTERGKTETGMEMGLLFLCQLGNVDLERPIGLLQHKQEGGENKIECTLMAQQTPAQRELVRQLNPQAAHCWWQGGHTGWAIFPMDSEVFIQTGQLSTTVPSSPDLTAPSSPLSGGFRPQSPSLPTSNRSVSPPATHHIAPPPPLHTSSLPGRDALYGDDMLSPSYGMMPPPKAPLSDSALVTRVAPILPPAALNPFSHVPGVYPTSPGLSPRGPDPPQVASPHLHHLPPKHSGDLNERVKRIKEQPSIPEPQQPAYAPHPSYAHNHYALPPPVHRGLSPSMSPSEPPPSPNNGRHHSPQPSSPLGPPAPLPTPFRPPDEFENGPYRPPLLTPLPPMSRAQFPLPPVYQQQVQHMPGGTYHHAGDFTAQPEVSLTTAVLTNLGHTPSFDLTGGGGSIDLPENWKQYEVLEAGSLTLPWPVHRANSGLETMQSIEEALPHIDGR